MNHDRFQKTLGTACVWICMNKLMSCQEYSELGGGSGLGVVIDSKVFECAELMYPERFSGVR